MMRATLARKLSVTSLLLLMIEAAPAAITGETTLTFDSILSAVSGHANVAPVAGGHCAGSGFTDCYYEKGIAVGTLLDVTNPIAHVHGASGALGYHADAPGVYLRAIDGSAFALERMDFSAPIGPGNPDAGANDVWEILGFNIAIDASLPLGDGTNYATRVAYQTVANGFDGELVLDAAFGNVNAVWIHFKGYPLTPIGKDFAVTLDNIVVNAAAPVPLPALPLPILGGLAVLLVGRVRARRPRD